MTFKVGDKVQMKHRVLLRYVPDVGEEVIVGLPKGIKGEVRDVLKDNRFRVSFFFDTFEFDREEVHELPGSWLEAIPNWSIEQLLDFTDEEVNMKVESMHHFQKVLGIEAIHTQIRRFIAAGFTRRQSVYLTEITCQIEMLRRNSYD